MLLVFNIAFFQLFLKHTETKTNKLITSKQFLIIVNI